MNRLNALFVVIMVSGLMGCQSFKSERTTHLNPQLSKVESLNWESSDYQIHPVPNPTSLFELSFAQKEAFLQYYHDPNHAQVKPNFRLANYLGNLVQGFSYSGDTYIAKDALFNQSGNCLSLGRVDLCCTNFGLYESILIAKQPCRHSCSTSKGCAIE